MVAIGNRKMICTNEEVLDLINAMNSKAITPIGEITDVYIDGLSVHWYSVGFCMRRNAKTYIITVGSCNEVLAESLTLERGLAVSINIRETIDNLVDSAYCNQQGEAWGGYGDYADNVGSACTIMTKSELKDNKYAIAKAIAYYIADDCYCKVGDFDKMVNEINKSLSANCKNIRIECVFHYSINEDGEDYSDYNFNIIPTE